MIKLRRTMIVLLCFLVVLSSFSISGLSQEASASPQVMPWRVVFEDFEDISDVRVTSAAANSTNLQQVSRPDPVMHGQYGVKLSYDFLGQSGTSAAYVRFKNAQGADGRPVEGKPVEIGFWIYGAGNNSWVRAQLQGKSADGTAVKSVIDFTTTTTKLDGWKYLTATIPSNLEKDIQLDFIYYVETSKKTKADLYFDEVSLFYQTSTIKEFTWNNVRDLGVGESVSSQFSVTYAGATQPTVIDASQVQLISSDDKVVSVSENGTITAKSEGNAELVAIYNDVTVTKSVNVVANPLSADSISIAAPKTLVTTESQDITVYANYANQIVDVTNEALVSSSNPAVVTANANTLTGKSYGTANITVTYATYNKQDLTKIHEITVQPGELRSIAFADTFSAIIGGTDVQAKVVGTYRIEGEKEITNGVSFTSSNTNIAIIHPETGVITPLEVGVVTLTAIYGDFQATTPLVITEANEPVKRELRGAWISTVENIDWPSKGDFDPKSQREDFIKLLDDLQATGINAVFTQVRPTADSFFPSEMFPWSKWLTGEQGVAPSDNYDPLAFMIEEAHKRNMEFHAWINPFRVSMNTDINELADGHIAKENPDWIVEYDGKLFFNPGVKEARDYIIASIEEIVDNYDVDGIHMDDYFYPYPSSTVFPDATQYSDYQINGGTLNLADWRRDNVNQVVSGLYNTIKAEKSYVKFGISPFGIWRNKSSDASGSATNGLESYSSIYADTRKWIQEGWIDYVAPQIYWHFGYSAAAYDVLIDWWMNEVETNSLVHDVHLYIGHATYKVGTANWEAPDQIPAQLRFNHDKNGGVEGSILFSSSHFLANPLGIRDEIQNIYATPSLIPVMPWLNGETPVAVKNMAIENTNAGVKLRWTDSNNSDNSTNYVIYRTTGNNSVDISDPSQIIAKVKRTINKVQDFEDKNTVTGETYNYVVTAVSRLHVESEASQVLTIKASTPKNPAPTPPTINDDLDEDKDEEKNINRPEDKNNDSEPSAFDKYSDVSQEHWAKKYLNKVLENNIFTGYPDGTLKPNAPMTRAEYVSALFRLNLVAESKSASQLKDINENDWYAKAVLSFAEASIVSGYEDGTFKPNQTLSREEAFVIIYRLIKPTLDVSNLPDLQFTDADNVSKWAIEAIKTLVSNGIIEGNDLGKINPKAPITRSEIAKIIAIIMNW